MGLTLHYKGKIEDLHQIEELQKEVQDICETMNWKFRVGDMEFNLPPPVMEHIGMEAYGKVKLSGVGFCPHPESEWVQLYFDQQGSLSNFMTLNLADSNTDPETINWCSTKTQYAGPEIHIAIVKLLDYLNKKYKLSIVARDEGDYWGSFDSSRLYNNFERHSVLQDIVRHALEGRDDRPAVSTSEILKQIDNILKRIGEKS